MYVAIYRQVGDARPVVYGVKIAGRRASGRSMPVMYRAAKADAICARLNRMARRNHGGYDYPFYAAIAVR